MRNVTLLLCCIYVYMSPMLRLLLLVLLKWLILVHSVNCVCYFYVRLGVKNPIGTIVCDFLLLLLSSWYSNLRFIIVIGEHIIRVGRLDIFLKYNFLVLHCLLSDDLYDLQMRRDSSSFSSFISFSSSRNCCYFFILFLRFKYI